MKNNKRKIKKEILVLSIIFILLLSYIPTFNNLLLKSLEFKNKTDLKPSDTNTLFNGKSYPFELNDFYDDEDLDHIWTGAKFQTEAFNDTSLEWTGVVNNDTVSLVNNTETQHGDPNNVNMISGTTDSTDNMRSNDASYTTFTSSHTDGYIYETPSQWDGFTFTNGSGTTEGELETIDADYSVLDSSNGVFPQFIDDITIITGTDGGGTVENTYIDDVNYKQYDSVWDVNQYKVNVTFDFDPLLAGRDFYISGHIYSTATAISLLIINGDVFKAGNTLDFDDEFVEGVNSIYYYAGGISSFYVRIYYFKLIEELTPEDAEIDVQVDMQVNDPELSSIEYLKYSHKSNISLDVDLDIWNWDTTTWYEIESVDNSATFDDDSFTLGNASPYVSGTNQVRIRFQASSSSSDFELLIDRFRLDYLGSEAELEMTITFPFARYNEDLLVMNVQSWQKTNVSQTMTFKIWNYDTESYVQISSSSDTSFSKKEHNTESPSDFISPSGVVKLYWSGSDTFNDFELHIDYLLVQIFYKLNLVHSKSFNTNGIYRHRWCVLGSIYYTQWVVFEVIDPEPNFYAISESELTTRWILQGAEITSIEDFHDDINTDYWNLGDVSNSDFDYSTTSIGDGYVLNNTPDTVYGGTFVGVTSVDTYTVHGHVKFIDTGSTYLLKNQTGLDKIAVYVYSVSSPDGSIQCYNTSTFSESTLTWNNAPTEILLQDSTIPSISTWNYWNIEYPNQNYMFKWDTLDSSYRNIQFHSREYGSLKPTFIRYDINKNYFGDGYMYMQTDTTELISLKSIDYGTYYNLSSGDYFEVDFQTSSDSQINLILMKDGGVNKTLTLSQSGNTNFNRHTVQISTDELVEFDQLKISGTLEDTDYVKIYDIKTYKYTITGDYADFYVGSKRDREIYLNPDVYNLRIEDYSSGLNLVNENITIPATGVKQYVYTPIATKQCRITFFNPQNVPLAFTDYHVYVNRSLGGSYNPFTLLENIFSVDVDTTVYIEIKDRFNTLIRNYEKLITPTTDYLDIELEVYSLQIKNLMTQKTTLTINNTLYDYPLLSGDSIYFTLSEAHYLIGYYDTNNVDKEFTIYLNDNMAFELNRSKICFLSYADQQGTHLYFENYKTYLNGSLLYENMFYREIGDKVGIEIKDRYNISIKNETYTVISGDNYIPITLTMYSLKVMSLQLVFNHVNITRDPDYYGANPYSWSTWLAPRETAEFKLFAGYYKINITNFEDGGWTQYDYTLNGDDYILIGSNNTIYNVLVNIANVNTTIGNQLTNIEINITNQNSQINNSVIQITINIESINSSLGTMLVDIDTAISNINTSIINEIVSLGTVINNINTSITNQILDIGVNITNMNSSIVSQLLTLGVDISNINGSIINQILALGVDVSNFNTSLSNQIISIGVDISNLDTSITNQIVSVISNITNVNTTLSTQITSLSSDISNVNSTIVNQIVALGVDITNINTSLSNQILSLEVDITNINTSIIDQILLVIADIENIETVIDDQTIAILADITNVNSTLLNQMVSLGVDVSNINVSITNQILSLGVDISNLDTSITNQIVSLGVNITNINTTISDQLLSLGIDITNINSSIISQILTLGVDISNINGSIINQILALGVDVSNFNTSLSNQILSLEVDITNINTSIIDQILLVIADIENIETVIDDQTIAILADITNVNSTLLNQMVSLGVDVSNINVSITNQILSLNVDLTNINASITNQILSLSVDLTNVNASISNLLFYLDIDITNIANNITSLYTFTNNSFINIDNTINTSFIYLENNIVSFNQSISNLVIGVSNDIYLINGTITTMITSVGTNLLLMNVSINTSLFNLNTTLNLIGSNITSNYILLNNSIDLTNLNINDSRIAMINNLLLINNTMSTLIADVYSSVYLINNSIYTAVVDLGTYLSLVNNTINGNLSIVLEQNEFLTEIYKMTMFSELLNWTNVGLNTSLLTSQIDVWEFINNYKDQSVMVHLRYQDLIDNLTISAQNTLLQHLPMSGVEYREWSVDLQKYIGEWKPLPENRTVDFGFYEADVPYDPEPMVSDFTVIIAFIIIIAVVSMAVVIAWAYMKSSSEEVPEDTKKRHKRKRKAFIDERKGFYDHT